MLKQNLIVLIVLLSALIGIQSAPISASNKCKDNQLCLNQGEQKGQIEKLQQKEFCGLCDLIVPVLRGFLRKNETRLFKTIANFICLELKIADKFVCAEAINLFESTVINVINETTLTNKEICSVFLNCGPINNKIINWNITLPNVEKPPVKPLVKPEPNAPKIRILQLTDIHIDFEYQPGSLSECDQPLCCRNSSSTKISNKLNSKAAGYWGEPKNCDIPHWTVENMFEHIAKNEQFDFIYWTGDLPPHNVWEQTRADQLTALDRLTQLFLKYFPDKIIFSSLGNHEAAPVNLFPTPNVKIDNITWLYFALSQNWLQTGLPNYLAKNITNGAFYTVSIGQGLRLISLNMNYCPNENFWLFINSTDPLNQLKWLAETLQNSENIGEKVHIIGHINPSSCLQSWSSNYYRIVNRYESTIAAQFFGHTHNDEFEIFYDLEDASRAVSVAFIAPSTTTYSFRNPGFRIYTVDGFYANSTFRVLNHENSYLNITEANLSMNPVWEKEYSFKDSYNLDNLFPQTLNDLIVQISENLNSDVFVKLYQFYHTMIGSADECDLDCRRKFVCKFKQARSDFFIKC